MEISRVTRSKAEAKASYDKMSKWYDLIAGGSEKKYREVGLRKLDAQAGESILEIGFGTGHSLLVLAQSVGSSGQVCGIDLSTGMCRVTQARLQKAGGPGNIVLTTGDAVSLPYPAHSFDAVFISFALELFDTPEIPRVLHECSRVLGKGGRICVVALSAGDGGGVVFYNWLHEKIPRYIDCRPIYAQAALEEAGFEILDTTKLSMWGLPVEIILAKPEEGKNQQ